MTDVRASDESPRLPWPFAAAFFIATAALMFSSKEPWRIAALQFVLAFSYIVRFRLPDSKVLSWTLRAVAWTALIGFGPRRHSTMATVIYEPDYVTLFGALCASEFVLRAWIRTRNGPSRVEAFLLTALIFTAATNTFDALHINVLAPLYAIAMILMFRRFSRREEARVPRQAKLVWLRVLALMLALIIGAGTVAIVRKYENPITYWAVHLLRSRKNPSSEIGLNQSPRLQKVFNPEASMTRVLLIDGPPSERHLRAMTFDFYSQTRWGNVIYPTVDQVDLSTAPAPDDSKELTITRLTDSLVRLPAPLNTARVKMEEDPVRRDQSGILNTTNGEAGSSYDLTVARSDSFQGPLCLAPKGDELKQLLQVPSDLDARVVELAKKLAPDADPMIRVQKLQMYLRSTHSYSLRYEPVGEPLSDFILNNRSAHCQYFASAMVVMCRAVGVPARMVAGYYAHERYSDSRMVVRDRDAHAWAEAYVDGIGWMTVDATPSAGRPDQIFEDPSKWRKWVERLGDLPAMIRSGFNRLSRTTVISAVLAIAAISLLTAGIRALWLKWRDRGKVRIGDYGPARADLREAARRFERVLQSRNLTCPPHRTWRDHLAATPVHFDRAAASEFVNTYDTIRFGGANGETSKKLQDILRRLEEHH